MNEPVNIGYVENYIKDHCVVMWFYRYEKGSWKMIWREKCHPRQREYILKKVMKDANLVALGRGT